MDPDSNGNRTFILLIIFFIIVLIYIYLREKIDSPYVNFALLSMLAFLNIVNMYLSKKRKKKGKNNGNKKGS